MDTGGSAVRSDVGQVVIRRLFKDASGNGAILNTNYSPVSAVVVATDGGSGEQGTSSMVARRATLWVHVGDTEFDRPSNAPSTTQGD